MIEINDLNRLPVKLISLGCAFYFTLHLIILAKDIKKSSFLEWIETVLFNKIYSKKFVIKKY